MRKTVLFWGLLVMVQLLFAQNPPVAVNDTFSIAKNTTAGLPVTSNDFDVDGDPLSILVPYTAAHGNAAANGLIIQYTPAFNYVGTDTVTYRLCDGGNLCDTAVVLIIITSGTNAPVAVDDNYTINKNTTATLPVTSNDFDRDGDPLSVAIPYAAAHGTATVTGTDVQYIPNFNFVGTDTFSYTLCDTTNRCDTAKVFITIAYVNNTPVAANDTFSVPEGVPTFLPVSGNDFDADGDPLTITLVQGAQHGTTVVTNGTQIIYTPAQFYYGPDSFTYIICDNAGACDSATVYVNVSGTNAHPVATDDEITFSDTVGTVTLDLVLNDHDDEGDSLFVNSVIDLDSNNTLGNVMVDPTTGQVVFSRLPLACGTETFNYLVCDIHGCDTGAFTITITCPDKVFLPQGFSPDGDGKNDKLVFTGLEYFAPAVLKVFNRYGTLVYESSEYLNDWDGTSLDSGKALPDGAYFYVLQLADKSKYNSYLIINR